MVLGLQGARRLLKLLFALRRAVVSLLAILVGLGPVPAHGADWTVPTSGGQAGAQNNASNTNSLASGLSKAIAVLSIASGGIYVAKGAEQLQCCAEGCMGAGVASQVEEKVIDDKSQKAATDVSKTAPTPAQRQPVNFQKLRFPDEARNQCPNLRIRPSSPGFLLLYEFLQPPRAEATLGGCLDAMLALTTGGLMILQGISSLSASKKTGQMASIAQGNAGNMGSIGSGIKGGGTSPTPDSNNGKGDNNNRTGSSLGQGDGSQDAIKIDPSLLRNGTANSIMSQLEKKFGINRDDFAKAVASGKDPREIFGSAPRNALSNDDMNKAIREANKLNDTAKNRVLAGTELSQAQKELSGKLSTGAIDPAFVVNAGGSGGNGAGSRGKGDKADSELDDLDPVPAPSEPPADLSPDVQAALAARDAEERRKGRGELSLFDQIHKKYREKSKMIFGYDPDIQGGAMRGVGNADGF